MTGPEDRYAADPDDVVVDGDPLELDDDDEDRDEDEDEE